jgi:capsular exopolysaccharide synthesis family protein
MSTQIATIQPVDTYLPENEPDYLSAVWHAFKRHVFAAVFIFGCVMALTIAALAVVTPRYKATTIVLVEGSRPPLVKPDSIMPGPPTDPEIVSSEIQVLLSRDLVGAIARELELMHTPEFDPNRYGPLRVAALDALSFVGRLAPDLAARFRAVLERPALVGPAYENAAINLIERNLSASAIGRSRAINVTFSSISPVTAEEFVSTLTRRYIENQELLKQTATEDANRRVTEKLSSLQQAAADTAQRVATFRAESNLTQGRDSTLIRQQISETSTELTAAITGRIAAQSRLHEIERAARDPTNDASAQVLDSHVIQELLIHQAKLAGDIARLSQTLGQGNPVLVMARAQADNVMRRVQVEAGKIAAGVRGEFVAAVEREHSLSAQLDKLKKEMARVQEDEVHLGQLEQNADAAKNVYELFLNRAKETAADRAMQLPDARIISHATEPLRPYFPNLKLALPIGAIVAMVLALLAILLMEARERGIRSQSEAGRVMGVPTLGAIPKFGGLPDADPYSMIGAAVSDLYMRIALGRSGKCVLVASALPREGKTTMALCLARMAGRSGKAAVLIDCDLRRSDLRARLSLRDSAGLSDVLKGGISIDDVMVRDVLVSEICIVPCGRPAENPAGLLSSRAMQQLLDDLRQRFDLIVIDTAPIMAAPETMSLAAAADETLLFVKWSGTPRATAVAACRKLRNIGVKVAGVVLTMVDVKRISKYSSVDGISYSKEVRRYYSREGRA